MVNVEVFLMSCTGVTNWYGGHSKCKLESEAARHAELDIIIDLRLWWGIGCWLK